MSEDNWRELRMIEEENKGMQEAMNSLKLDNKELQAWGMPRLLSEWAHPSEGTLWQAGSGLLFNK